jgi:hypothetical protein
LQNPNGRPVRDSAARTAKPPGCETDGFAFVPLAPSPSRSIRQGYRTGGWVFTLVPSYPSAASGTVQSDRRTIARLRAHGCGLRATVEKQVFSFVVRPSQVIEIRVARVCGKLGQLGTSQLFDAGCRCPNSGQLWLFLCYVDPHAPLIPLPQYGASRTKLRLH